MNYPTGLSALWTWAVEEDLVDEHIIRKVKRIKTNMVHKLTDLTRGAPVRGLHSPIPSIGEAKPRLQIADAAAWWEDLNSMEINPGWKNGPIQACGTNCWGRL